MSQKTNTLSTAQQQPRSRLTNQWLWLAVGWIIGLILGFIGFYRYSQIHSTDFSSLDLIYLLLQLIALESGAVEPPIPWQLNVARFALPALTAWTLLRAAMTLFREQATRFWLRFWNGHVIICGFGHKGSALAENLLLDGKRVVIVEQSQDVDGLKAIRSLGAVILIGDATRADILNQAGVQRATTLVSVLGDDSLNAEVATRASAILASSRRPALHCLIHIVDPDMWDLLRAWELRDSSVLSVRLELFNIYQRGAELLLQEFLANANGQPAESRPVKIYIIGLGNLGQHLIIQIAERRFRNWQDSQPPLELTLVDPQAELTLTSLCARYPQISEVMSIRALDMSVKSAGFLRGDYIESVTGGSNTAGIFICLDDDPRVLSTALTVRRHLAGVDTDIVMRLFDQNGLSPLVRASTTQLTSPPNLIQFPLIERTCTKEVLTSGTHERLARALHDSYLRNQPNNERADGRLPQWNRLSEELKNANRSQADNIARMLSAAGYSLTLLRDWADPPEQLSNDEIEELAKLEHSRWCAEKKRNGWRYASAPKSEEARTHPDLLAWDELPESSRDKNRAAIRSLPLLLHEAGFKVHQPG